MAISGSTANGACVTITPDSTGIIQQGQGVAGVISQPSPVVQYAPQHFVVTNPGSQPLGSMYPRSPAEQLEQLRKEGMMKIFLKAQPKPLGAIQILIGLIHISFGAISAIFIKPHAFVSGVVGYPFWGGILFIMSGSLSVAAENHQKTCLVRGSRGMNTTSACASSIGAVLLITELILSGIYDNDNMHDEYIWVNVKKAITVMLLLCTILECSIAISTSYFGCKAMWYTPNTAMLFQPYGACADVEVPYAPMPPPPPYTDVAYDP